MTNELQTITADSPIIVEQRVSVGQLLETIDALTVDDNDAYELMDTMLSDVHDRTKRLDKVASGILDPLSAALKNARALFAPLQQSLDIAKSTAKRKMIAYKDRLRAEREAEEARLEREAAQAREEAARQLEVAEEKFMAGEGSIEELDAATIAAASAQVAVPQSNLAPMPQGQCGSGTEWTITLPTDNKDVAALLEFIAADLRKDAPRFGNTVSFKVTELKAFVKSTNGQVPVPGLKFNNTSKIIAR